MLRQHFRVGILSLWLLFAFQPGIARGQDQRFVEDLMGAVAKGNSLAAATLGCLYKEGNGVPRDLTEAHRLLKFAAESGETIAMIDLGDLLIRSDRSADVVEGRAWLLLALERTETALQKKLIQDALDNLRRFHSGAEIQKAEALLPTLRRRVPAGPPQRDLLEDMGMEKPSSAPRATP